MATKPTYKKRWRYVIDKDFQLKFIFKYSTILLAIFVIIITAIWFVRSKSYSLLPKDASLLAQVDANNAVYISKGEIVKPGEGGVAYFPVAVSKCKNQGLKPNIYNAFDLYIGPLLFISILNMVLIIVFSLFYSHKMAGPVMKIKMTLQDVINKKKPSSIKLRENDEHKELAELINQALKLK